MRLFRGAALSALVAMAACDAPAGEAQQVNEAASAAPTKAVGPMTVAINEIHAHDDYIEFYNYGKKPVNLGGFVLSDSGEEWTIPADAEIPPGGFILFTQNKPGSFTFGLAAGGERITLKANGKVVDETNWSPGQAGTDHGDGISWGRFPDGAGDFRTAQWSPTKKNHEH